MSPIEADFLGEESEENSNEPPTPETWDGVRRYLATLRGYPPLSLEEEIALARKIREGQEAAEKLSCATNIEAAVILRVARSRVLEEPPASGLPVPSAEERERVEALCYATREARRLYLLVREGESARRELVLASLRLVVAIARSIAQKRNLDLWDAIGEGNRGLLRATETFDERLGYRFSTYAAPWIRKYVLRYALQMGRFIRLPARKEETLGKLHKARAQLAQELNRLPSPEEMAERVGEEWTAEKIEELLEEAPGVYSLDEPVPSGDGEGSWLYGDLLRSPLPSPEETALNRVRREAILEVLTHLPPREAEVLRLHYGLDGAPLSLGEIARRFKLTRGRVRQLERRAISRLQQNGHAQRLKGFED